MARTSRNSTPLINSKPVTPAVNGITPSRETRSSTSQNGLNHLRQRLEQKLKQNTSDYIGDDSDVKTSPTLEKLRMTPGRVVKDRQLLMRKHIEARQKADTLHVGGGFTLWPNMDDMRLNRRETVQLLIVCVVLLCAVLLAFKKLHGEVIRSLMGFHLQLTTFHSTHPILVDSGQDRFIDSILQWHKEYKILLENMHATFDVLKFPKRYILYILLYSFGMGVLVYYLVDNMFAKSKLSPRRIQRWVSSLVVIGTWTGALLYFLVCAYIVESAIEQNIHQLGEILGNAVETNLDLNKFNSVLLYWKTRCLPPTTTGTLNILGILAVRDVMHYFQYYSLPVITVLLTPVIKLIMSLHTVYCIRSP